MYDNLKKTIRNILICVMALSFILALLFPGTVRWICGITFLVLWGGMIIGWPIIRSLPNDWFDRVVIWIKRIFGKRND